MHIPAVAACGMRQFCLVALRADRVIDGFESMVCTSHSDGAPAHFSHRQHCSVLQSICKSLAERVCLTLCTECSLVPVVPACVKRKSCLTRIKTARPAKRGRSVPARQLHPLPHGDSRAMGAPTVDTPDHTRGPKNRDFFCYYAWPPRLNRIEKIAHMTIHSERHADGLGGCENERFGGFASEIAQTVKPL